MRVAVLGGGLFGATAAFMAARAGHDVHLFEAKSRLMSGATSGCYYRLHRGYHYPRSPETGEESLAAEALFRAEYGRAVIDGGTQLYAIPFRCKVSGLEFERFMERMGLPYRRLSGHELLTSDCVFDVAEPRIDAAMLAQLVSDRIVDAGITVDYGVQDLRALRDEFDRIVVATYANTNSVLAELGCEPQEYRFQVVEKPIVELPSAFRDISIVVMDQCCIDPHQWSTYHALGHVIGTIHSQNSGVEGWVSDKLEPLIERGLIRQYESDVWELSRVRETAELIADHVPDVKGCNYIGSMFTLRAVLTGVERTDARPTLVDRIDNQVIRVFSGKLGTAVTAARDVVAMLRVETLSRAVA